MAGVFALSEHFNVSPHIILDNWDYPMFLDGLERLEVIAEIEKRKNKASE